MRASDIYQALTARAEAEHRSLAQQTIVDLPRIPEVVVRESRLAVLKESRGGLRQSRRTGFPALPRRSSARTVSVELQRGARRRDPDIDSYCPLIATAR